MQILHTDSNINEGIKQSYPKNIEAGEGIIIINTSYVGQWLKKPEETL